AGLDDRGPHLLCLFPGTEQLESRRAGHPMVQGADLPAGDRELAHVEELDVRQWTSSGSLEDVEGRRSLNLVPVELPPAGRVDRGSLVSFHFHVVVASLSVVLDPV